MPRRGTPPRTRSAWSWASNSISCVCSRYGYTWFCEHFAAFERRTSATFGNRHAAGAAMQTDYAGQTVPVVDPVSGVIFPAHIFVAVLIVERWILARLRNRSFFSLAELNAAIAELLEELNNRPMRHVGKSRREHNAHRIVLQGDSMRKQKAAPF